jgi:hypothetical protein
MMRQEEEEAQIMAWAARVIPSLETIFEKDEVEGAVREGDLLIRVTMNAPLEGRPNANGLLHIRVTREALDDYLLQEQIGALATEKFLALIKGRARSYVPVPSEDIHKEPQREVWLIRSEDVRIR